MFSREGEFITIEHLRTIAQELGEKVSTEELQDMILEADTGALVHHCRLHFKFLVSSRNIAFSRISFLLF